MKKLSSILFVLIFLPPQVFAQEMGGVSQILIDQTDQISKSACIARDPKNARIYEEIWGKWEDENKEVLLSVREVRMAIETKFEQIDANNSGEPASEMKRRIYPAWLRTRELILARMRESWDKLSDDEVEKLCESIIAAFPEPLFQTAAQDALTSARKILETLMKQYPERPIAK